MIPARLFVLSALFAFASATSALAQYTVGKITFAGAPPSQQAALEQTAKLHPGQDFSAADLQSAAQRLSDTGAFDDVQVKLAGPYKSIAVAFALQPVPAASLLTVSFSNFFWLTPAELATGVASRVPLFGPALPESGNLIDSVTSALADLLQQHGITAKVTHEVFEPSSDRQARIVAYRVSDPLIVVHTVHLGGISPEFAPGIRTGAAKVTGSLLSDGLESRTTDDRLLTSYLDAGYITAHIANRKLTPITSTPNQIELDLAGTVVPGPLLHVGTLTWAGSPEISSAAFAAAAPLHPGAVASLADLRKTSDLLAAPFRKQGYADVVVTSSPQVDTAASTVSYTFTVTPGEQYRVKSITPLNLNPTQQADFDRTWRMKPGDLFNPDYITHFLDRNTALRSFDNTSASYKTIRDPAAHLADVTIIFVSGITGVAP